MKKIIIILIFIVSAIICSGQTFVEMMSPEDANVVLLKVTDPNEADIIIYLTDDNKEAQEWDCMWKIRKWGFANFSLFIATDTTQLIMTKEETLKDDAYTIPYQGKVYFTTNKNERKYKNPSFRIDGVMKVVKRTKKFYID